MSDVIVSSRVRLARNSEDLPFQEKMTAGQAAECAARTLAALRETPESYRYVTLSAASAQDKTALQESHLISADLMRREDIGAALIRADERLSVMMNEEDHLRLQAIFPGESLDQAAQAVFAVEEAVQANFAFAFDEQLGYLTACPTNTGTGMRASALLHLPMLRLLKQMGKVNQLAAKLGLTLRGVYGEGSEARGCLYLMSNQATLGQSEQELLQSVSAMARKLAEMEDALRARAMERRDISLEDQIFRAYGLCANARRMPIGEFMAHWSSLRLGAALGLLPLTTAQCDALLTAAQPAHVECSAGRRLTAQEQDEERSRVIRGAIQGG